MFDDMDDAESERQHRLAAERLARWTADTPPVFAREGHVHPDVAEWLDGLTRGRATNLTLVGEPGTTKTWHCYRLVREALAAGWQGSARLLTSQQWKRAVTPPLDYADLDRLAGLSLLILDDLGATRISDWDAENLLGVLDERWKFRRPTVVTSNVADVRSMVGERIASRLADDQLMVTLDGPDMRREGR
ncbi:ATP-binding protein [Sphaerisporangium sp. NBC_01403]|uniref:ATP-binding protein n=1 Tax=Sphaerisporangium sp. NBC_01403 TaxID=2903599 RepID=UPI003246F178